MRPLLKSLLAAASFLTLAPQPASALPRQCDEVCSCRASCGTLCAIGTAVVTCGFEEYCIDYCRAPSQEQASVSEEPTTSEDAAPVCAEEAPSAES